MYDRNITQLKKCKRSFCHSHPKNHNRFVVLFTFIPWDTTFNTEFDIDKQLSIFNKILTSMIFDFFLNSIISFFYLFDRLVVFWYFSSFLLDIDFFSLKSALSLTCRTFFKDSFWYWLIFNYFYCLYGDYCWPAQMLRQEKSQKLSLFFLCWVLITIFKTNK